VRFAANLLFQYGVDGKVAARPLCEKRIVVLRAPSGQAALRLAKRYGSRAQYSYRNADGDRFRVRFLGVIDLIDLTAASDPQEAYFTMFRTTSPKRHLRRKGELSVFRNDARTIASAWWAVPAWFVEGSPAKMPRRSGSIGTSRGRRRQPR
jgi:hypothetical protein